MGKKKEIEVKEETQLQGIKQGVYDSIVIVPQTTQREQTIEEITTALKDGKFFVMREGYTRNSVYTLIRNLKEKYNIAACFGVTETNGVKQFVLFVNKEKA